MECAKQREIPTGCALVPKTGNAAASVGIKTRIVDTQRKACGLSELIQLVGETNTLIIGRLFRRSVAVMTRVKEWNNASGSFAPLYLDPTRLAVQKVNFLQGINLEGLQFPTALGSGAPRSPREQ